MSGWRVVQNAEFPWMPLVALYHVGAGVDARLRAAAPGCGIACRDVRVLGAQPSDVDAAAKATGATDGPRIIGGWSAGCQSVRSLLLAGMRPDGVLAIDGTSGPWPLAPDAVEVRVWRDLAARARAGECRAVLSYTQQTYTEGIPRGVQGGPYASTRTVVTRATGVSPIPGGFIQDGGLRVVASPSKTIDADAHIREQRQTLPEALAWMVQDDDAATFDPLDVGLSRAAAIVQWIGNIVSRVEVLKPHGLRALAVAETQVGVRETPGAGSTKQVLAYLYGCVGRVERGIRAAGKRLGLADDSHSWCAAFVGWCDHTAATDTDRVPPWRAAVWEIVADARDAGTWRDVASGYQPEPGDLVGWRRAGGDPRNVGQQGHVSRIAEVNRATGLMRTIGGNESDAVLSQWRSMTDASIVGYVKRSA